MHSKLNDLIYPLLNQLKVEEEEYYSQVLADAIANSLLPALKKAGKIKPLDAVLNLLAKSLVKDDDTPETLGCLKVVELWTKQDPFGLFEIYGSGVLTKCVAQDLSQDGPECLMTFQYIVFTGRLVETLLIHFVQNKPKGDARQSFNEALSNIVGRVLQLLGSNIPHSANLVVNMFHLLSSLKMCDLRTELVLYLVQGLDNLNTCSFMAFEELLEACLRTNKASVDEDLDARQILRQKVDHQFSSEVLKYLGIFLLPLIKSVHRSSQIFLGDDTRTMQILSKLI